MEGGQASPNTPSYRFLAGTRLKKTKTKQNPGSEVTKVKSDYPRSSHLFLSLTLPVLTLSKDNAAAEAVLQETSEVKGMCFGGRLTGLAPLFVHHTFIKHLLCSKHSSQHRACTPENSNPETSRRRMAEGECSLVWEVLPLSSSSGIVLPLKVAGAATFTTRSHKLENEEKNIAHRARPIT